MSPERLVVVGVDGSDDGRRALTWALRHAAESGATVRVVTVYAGDEPTLAAYVGSDRHRAETGQQADIAAAVADLEVVPAVEREIVAGDAVAALTRAAQGADMLVVGSHGRSHVRTALLGSVSAGCIRHGTTPVVVVPTPKGAPRQREVVPTPAQQTIR